MSSSASSDSFRSAHSSSSDSVHSQTSTLEYGHESFETFHDKVESLCRTLWPDSTIEFKIERGPGGSYNRIIAIAIHKSHSPTATQKLILRIPRFDDARIDRETAAVRFVRQNSNLAVPKILASDLTTENVLQLPYVLQNRLPGVSLHTVFPNLSHQQKTRIAQLIGQVLDKLLRITSPVSGIIEESPQTVKLEQPVVIAEPQQRNVFRQALRALVRKSKSKIPSRVVNAVRGPRHSFIVRPFDIKGPNDELGAAETLATDVQGTTSTEDVLQMLLNQFMHWKAKWLKAHPKDRAMAEYYDRFATTAKEMHRLGLLENDSEFTLCHLDLAPRNILVEIKSEASSSLPSSISISGILDWDSAVFAPRVLSCTPPSWIWAWAEDESEDEATANDVPPTSAAQELKRTFEAAVGEDFLRLCYEPHHRLVRKLITFAIFGMHSNEELKDADGLLEEWKKMSINISTARVGEEL